MIRCLIDAMDDVESLTTSQFIQGIKLGKVTGFHVEDYGMLTEDGRAPGFFGMAIRKCVFLIDTRKGDIYWHKAKWGNVQRMKLNSMPTMLQRESVEDILKDMGITD